MTKKSKIKYILGIETSCDDTAIGIINTQKQIKSNIKVNQNNFHKHFGGIVPEIAARAHLEYIDHVLNESLEKANLTLSKIDLFCATGGPGLIGGLIVGSTFCKALAWSHKKPFIAVNHLAGHALSARLTFKIDFPFLLLLVSGGHTQLIAVVDIDRYIRISTTLDDTAGETFDKSAKILNLGFPGGPLIEKLSLKGDENAFKLPKPMYKSKNPNFSFSGLKTSFSKLAKSIDVKKEKNNLSASLQKCISDCLIDRTKYAIKEFKKIINYKRVKLVAAGGVASNNKIRLELKKLSEVENVDFFAPPLELCTDNGPMIAWAGYENFLVNNRSMFDFKARPRWPLDPIKSIINPTNRIIGKKGVKG